MTNPEPCSVCGGTDLNLVDGYYYCVECGTQDVNTQETVVEHTVLADGTFAHAASRKITKILKDAIEMSGEWHKWHTFNFILIGLVEELIALGASTSFRDRALWIWTRYMKKFMDKDKMGTINQEKEKEGMVIHKSLFEYEDELEESILKEPEDGKNDNNLENEINSKTQAKKEKEKKKQEQEKNRIKVITKGVLISILYVALNFDKSDIQLSNLFRFIREGHLSFANCIKFVPSELDLKSIPCWKNFMNCNKEYTAVAIRQTAMTLIKVLDLGKPVIPNLRKLVDVYVKELCLPVELKNLVFSLLHRVPCDFLDVNYNFAKKVMVRTPDYEGVVMSYVVVGLKMTFGLDDCYEIILSDTVEKINLEKNRLKSYKLGLYSNSVDRLFSFREWSKYLQFRKIMLCRNYLPMAQQHNLDVDDKVFIEHLGKRQKRKIMLSDDVTMDILDKIVLTDDVSVIPKSEFFATLTPLSDYTDIVLQYIQDPEVKLLISEDFTQYSMKYVCEELELLNGEENVIKGVSENDKTINKMIVGNLISKEHDYSLVYVRNCENLNWLKTNPPTIDHITKIEDSGNDRDSDHGYDSNLENTPVEIEISQIDSVDKESKVLEVIEEEQEGKSMFDDNFDDIEEMEDKPDFEADSNEFQLNNGNVNNTRFDINLETNINDQNSLREVQFNPETFQREMVIKKLVTAECKKYKIPVPKEYDTRTTIKRKHDDTEALISKKRKVPVDKVKRGENKEEINKIIKAYYTTIERDLLEQVSENLKSLVKDYVGEENVEPDNEIAVENYEEDLVNVQPIADNSNQTQQENDFGNTAGSSVMEVDAEPKTTIYDLIPKVNPNFDEKTHDTKQLFLKYIQNLHFENILDQNDPNIDNILKKKIEECELIDTTTLCAKDFNTTIQLQDNYSDSDDDELLKELEEEIILQAQKAIKLEPLILNPEVKEFKYWTRHFTSLFMRKNKECKEKFDVELKENFPKSFQFVMKECAAILDCTTFSLYKHVQNLEQVLFR